MQSNKSFKRFTARDKRAVKILILLGVVSLLSISLFLFQGLDANNFDFAFPRRMRKVGAMILVSICIGYSSTVFQTITENRILTPSVMGLDSLYLFIQTLVTFLFGAKKLALMDSTIHFGISVCTMMLASWLIYKLVFTGENSNVYVLVLVGMIMGTFFQGISSFLQLVIDPNEFAILQGKMFATFQNVNEKLLIVSALITLAIIIFSKKDVARFDVLGLGRDASISLGIEYRSLLRRSLLIISVMVSVSTVLVGPVTFLGILLVSLSREILKTYRHSYMITGSILIGIIALPIGQLLSERVFSGKATLSVILNFVGGIYFIYILLKESRR
jgi:iron complex transport system permease protein